jgi:hypothetical protein
MPPFVGVKMIKPPIHSWFNARWFLSSGVCCLKKYEEFISFMVIILDILNILDLCPIILGAQPTSRTIWG